MEELIYKLRKTFLFRNSNQAKAFLEVANIYGKGRVFGTVVILNASLEFPVWRKIENLARIVSDCPIQNIDIYKMSSQAGFKAFRQASP